MAKPEPDGGDQGAVRLYQRGRLMVAGRRIGRHLGRETTVAMYKSMGSWLKLFDNFSRWNNLECRLREATHRFAEASNSASGAPEMPKHTRDEIQDHLSVAGCGQLASTCQLGHEDQQRWKGPFEVRLRELFTAERELIPYLPGSRCAAAIADLRTDIAVWVPEARRAMLFERLDEAAAAHQQNKSVWRDLLFAVKCEADEIVIDSYRARERLRDGITVLGIALGVTVFLMIISILLSRIFQGPGLFSLGMDGNVGEAASGAALVWMAFLCGSFGACLSGLFSFTVNRAAPGEYETIAATVIRPLIGGACGMFAVALVATGVLNFGAQEIPALAIGAVILGFSERIVMGTVENLGARVNAGSTAGAGAATNPAGTSATAPVVRAAAVPANDPSTKQPDAPPKDQVDAASAKPEDASSKEAA